MAFELEGVVLAGVPARWPWRYHMPATVGMADTSTSLRHQDPGGWIHIFSRSVIEIQPDFH